MVNWLLDNRFIGSISPPLHLEWRDFALLVLRTQSFLYGWWDCVAITKYRTWDCVRLQKRVSFMCAALRTRAGEDVSCTKAPKHQSTKALADSAAVQQDSAHQSRGVQSGCSAPRNPHPPSSSFPPTAAGRGPGPLNLWESKINLSTSSVGNSQPIAACPKCPSQSRWVLSVFPSFWHWRPLRAES